MQKFIDCLRIAWAGKQMQYFPPYGLLEIIFFPNDSSKQKSFHLLARELHDEGSTSNFAKIICFEHLEQGSYEKNQPWVIFARVPAAKCVASCNHDGSLEDDYCLPFFKFKLKWVTP